MGLYLRKNSAVWQMRYWADGRAHDESTGTRDRRKAELVLAQKRAERSQKKLATRMGVALTVEIADAKMTIQAFIERFREHYVNAGGPALRESRERSWRSDSSSLKTLVGYFDRKGLARVAQVAARHVEAFRDWRLTTGVAAATVNKDLRCGKAAWSWAVRVGIAAANPFKAVRPVKTPQGGPRNLSEFEARRVLATARETWLFPVVATALYAGLRAAELAALEWPDVNLGRPGAPGTIRLACDETFRTKSRKPRLIPLAPELRAILAPLAKPVGLCFPTATGNRLDGADLRHAVARIARRAGVEFSLHDLRRTFAGMLAARGVPAWRIRDCLGHASIATTEGYYVARGSIDPADVEGLRFGIEDGSGDHDNKRETA